MDHPDRHVIVSVRTNEDDIMTLKEKALSILSCKYIDGVVLDLDMGTLATDIVTIQIDDIDGGEFDYLTKETIVNRIISQRDEYVSRNKRKGF